MRFLIIAADKYPPTRVDVDVLFGQEVPRRGNEIDWVLQSDSPRKKNECISYGGGIAFVGRACFGETFFAKAWRETQALIHSFRVIVLARRKRYDFIQAKNVFVRAVPALIAARISGAKFIYWLSYPFPEAWLYEAKTRVAERRFVSAVRGRISRFLLYRIILPFSDFAFVQSEQMKRDISAEGISTDKMHPVPMGVSDEMISRGGEPSMEREPIVLYVGTMIPVRRMDFLVRVFRRVHEDVPEATLCMVGGESTADIERLEGEARRLGVEDHVKFTGMVPLSEAMAWMRRARVCVSPFYPTPILNSTSPTKLVEYMSQGAAVVANDHPEQSMVIAESGGGICVEYDEQEFASAIITLLRDPVLASSMGTKGQAYVRQFRSYSHIADRLVEKYRKILSAR